MNIPNISKSQWRGHKYIKGNFPEFYKYLLDNYPEDILFAEKLYWWEHGIDSHPVCLTCGKKLKFKDGCDGYGKYCCSKCANSNSSKKDVCRQTCLSRYGVSNPSQSQPIRDKIILWHKSHPDFIKQVQQTCLSRYGVSNPSQIPGHKQKCMLTNKRKCGAEWHMMLPTYKAIHSHHANQIILQKYPNAKCVRIIQNKRYLVFNCDAPCRRPCKLKEFIVPINSIGSRKTIKCPQKTHSKATSIELKVRDFLIKHQIDFVVNTRKPVKGYELDIFIPTLNLAIEINGMYYHSLKFRPKQHHANKFNACESAGIKLLTLWEDEINNEFSLVCDKIRYMLGLKTNFSPIDENLMGCLDTPLNDNDSQSYKILSRTDNEFWYDARTFVRSSLRLKGKYIYHIYGNPIAQYEKKKATKGKD